VARPSSYKPEYAEQLLAYFNKPASEVVQDGDKRERVPCQFPTLAGFACQIGVHRATLLNWSGQHEEFFDALKMAKEHQERILVQNGLDGSYDRTFAIFTAKNLIDWRDKVEQEVSGPNGGPIQTKSTLDVSGLNDDQLRAIASIKADAG